jgi:P-type conjugative transfer protein TrbL
LLLDGNIFAKAIIQSLSTLGAEAGDNDGSLHPGALINLGLRVLKMSVDQINLLLPAATGIPVAFAIIILIVCALMAVNMILLLCAARIVVYAGLVVLGFGGCRWTSDIAINYFRTVLGVGVSLMTMQLVIALGIQFLTQLVDSASTKPDVYQLAIVMCATIILAVIAHKLPQMVAGMVLGGGHNGAIGGVGMMTLLAAGMTGMSLAGRFGGNPAAALATEGVGEGAKMLQDRIAAAEAAMSSQSSQASMTSQTNDPGAGSGSSASGGSGSGAAPLGKLGGVYGRRARSRSGGGEKARLAVGNHPGSSGSGATGASGSAEPPEPPLDRPITPDEARGFGPDGNGGGESDDQAT